MERPICPKGDKYQLKLRKANEKWKDQIVQKWTIYLQNGKKRMVKNKEWKGNICECLVQKSNMWLLKQFSALWALVEILCRNAFNVWKEKKTNATASRFSSPCPLFDIRKHRGGWALRKGHVWTPVPAPPPLTPPLNNTSILNVCPLTR